MVKATTIKAMGRDMSSEAKRNSITGRSAFLALLKDEGVTKLFGNPGTTELPIMHAMTEQSDISYVLGLQEAIVVAMADGYARATGEIAAVNVHVAPGLGNAMGALYTANFSGSPVIITAGQQEQGHGLTEPLLYAPLVPIAQPLVKWAVEVNRIEDLPRIMRRAAKVALTPPTGPVFISLPGDILNMEAAIDLGECTRVDAATRPSDGALEQLAARLAAAERPVIVAGHEIVASAAIAGNRAGFQQIRRQDRRQIMEEKFMSAILQMSGHGRTHDPQPNKAHLHARLLIRIAPYSGVTGMPYAAICNGIA